MNKERYFITPLNCEMPQPKHTIVEVRCFTCDKFEVCSIRNDYLKTATLISEILGHPQENFELNCIPGFCGENIEEPEKYIPAEVKSVTMEGNLIAAKACSPTQISLLYCFDKRFVIFKASYNEETDEFDVGVGEEVCYKLKFQLDEASQEEVKIGLMILKEELEGAQPTEKDIINTTAFSAMLNCEHYSWKKGYKYEDGVKELCCKYPNGIPMGDDEYYHLATFHIEPNKVPYYHPENGTVALAPLPYPVYLPPKCEKKIFTRDELNEF